VSEESTPFPPHLAAEFLLWFWWRSERDGTVFDLAHPVGRIEAWVEDRLSFRTPGADKATAVLTGDNPSATLEARAALAGGKVLHDLRVHLKRDDREYAVQLGGTSLDVRGLKLPKMPSENPEEALLDRLDRYGEFHLVLSGLFRAFAEERTGGTWRAEVVPALRAWARPEVPGETLSPA